MAKLIYSMFTSLDGYTEDADGHFGWGAETHEGLHRHINELTSSIGTYLFGRRMYETMAFWETALGDTTLPDFVREYAQDWLTKKKIVFSRTLVQPRTSNTELVREFDPALIRQLKEESSLDLAIDGPELASHALRAGLVDELQVILCPIAVGAGKRYLSEGIKLRLQLLGCRSFSNGVNVLRYALAR